MGWQQTPFTIPLAVAAGIAGTMFVLALTQRGEKGAGTLLALFGAMAVYAGAYAAQLASTGYGWKLLFHALRFLGPTFVTVAFFVFALQYTGRESMLGPGTLALLGVVPVVTTVLVWTDVYGVHNLVLAETGLDTVGGIQRLVVTDGPWYHVHAGYSLALALFAIVLFVGRWLTADGDVGKQARLFALSATIPVAGTAVYLAGYSAIDWGPVTYVVSGLVLVVAIFSY